MSIIYYRGKIVGGIYDDRFLGKNVKAASELMPDASLELPYEGTKEMLLVDDIDNKSFLKELLEVLRNLESTSYPCECRYDVCAIF